MNTMLWIVQGVLTAAFLMLGMMKLIQPKAKLAENMAVFNDFEDNQIKGIGILEILAAIGIILPPLLGIAPIFSPLAAVGLVLLMIGAAVTHNRRREPQLMAVNAVLGLLAAFVAVGRFILLPF